MILFTKSFITKLGKDVSAVSLPSSHELFKLIDSQYFTGRTSNLLTRKGFLCNGDFAIRTKSEITSIRGIGSESMDEITGYIIRHRITFRLPSQSIAERITDLFTYVQQAPVTYISIVVNPGWYPLSQLIEHGICTIGDLEQLTPEMIASTFPLAAPIQYKLSKYARAFRVYWNSWRHENPRPCIFCAVGH